MRVATLLPLLLVLPALASCSTVDSLDSAASGSGCGAEGCFSPDAAPDAGASDVSTDIGNDAVSEAASPVNPLCGVLTCNPDDDEAVQCNAPPTGDAGEPDSDAGSGDADADDAAPDDDASAEAGSMGGSMGDPSEGKQPSGPAKPDDAPSDNEGNSSFACQVTADEQGNRTATCVPAGSGVQNDPCVTSADCSAGHACVGDSNAGVCRSYCCLDPEACAQGTYCGVLPSRDPLQDDPSAEFLLPVCVPADDCELLPGAGGTNRCADGLMCAIVRSNGTTACVVPGEAKDGEPCEEVDTGQSPCAEGHVCSRATNTCLALCRIGVPDACAGGGVCQAGTDGIPEGYGICVGARD